MNDPVEDEGLSSLPPFPRVGYQTGRGIEGGYWRNFNCYELEAQALNAKPKTMRRWAEESAAQGGALILPLPDHFVAVDLDEAARKARWAQVQGLVEQLSPATLLLRTRAQLRPSTENIAALRALLTARPQSLPPLAWWPEGLWSPEMIRELTEALEDILSS